MSFAVSGVVCFAILAFVGPILLFVSAVLLHRRIQRERQKSVIFRVSGLDPPIGTRDPALLWPSVLATPAEEVEKGARTLITPRSGLTGTDDDDSHIAKRPASVASSASRAGSGASTQTSPSRSESAEHGTLPRSLFAGLTPPPAAVVASTPRSHTSDDCRITVNDIHCSRDQSCSLAATPAASTAGSEHSSRPHKLQLHSAESKEVVRHWGTPMNHTSDTDASCSTGYQHAAVPQSVHVVVMTPGRAPHSPFADAARHQHHGLGHAGHQICV